LGPTQQEWAEKKLAEAQDLVQSIEALNIHLARLPEPSRALATSALAAQITGSAPFTSIANLDPIRLQAAYLIGVGIDQEDTAAALDIPRYQIDVWQQTDPEFCAAMRYYRSSAVAQLDGKAMREVELILDGSSSMSPKMKLEAAKLANKMAQVPHQRQMEEVNLFIRAKQAESVGARAASRGPTMGFDSPELDSATDGEFTIVDDGGDDE
jgi:hypothetical protein